MWPIDVWFQIDVHCVSVRAVKPATPEQQEILDKLGDKGTRCESCGEPLPKFLEECVLCGAKRDVPFWDKHKFRIISLAAVAIIMLVIYAIKGDAMFDGDWDN